MVENIALIGWLILIGLVVGFVFLTLAIAYFDLREKPERPCQGQPCKLERGR